MQMIFNALSGSSGQVPVTPVGGGITLYGNSVHFRGCAELQVKYRETRQLQHSRVPYIMWLRRFFAAIRLASTINACYSHRT